MGNQPPPVRENAEPTKAKNADIGSTNVRADVAIGSQRGHHLLVRTAMPVILIVVLVVLGSVLPVAALYQLDNVLALVLFAVATNLLVGYSGLISFGQAAFYGLGAYIVAGGVVKLGQPFWLTMIEAPVIGGLVAAAVGMLALRTRGLYFALIMVAFSQLFYSAAIKLYPITNGENGIFGTVLPDDLAEPVNGYYLAVAIVLVSLLLLWVVVRSPFGLVVQAIRDNPGRAESLGVPRYSHQLLVFAISGAFCSVAGTVFVIGNQSANPGMLNWVQSSIPVVAIMLGGMRYFLGPAAGAIIYQYGHDAAVQYTSHWQLVLGLVIIIVVLLAPGGIGRIATVVRHLKFGSSNHLKNPLRARIRREGRRHDSHS